MDKPTKKNRYAETHYGDETVPLLSGWFVETEKMEMDLPCSYKTSRGLDQSSS